MFTTFNGAVVRQPEDIFIALENFKSLHSQYKNKIDDYLNDLKSKQVKRWWGGKTSAYHHMQSVSQHAHPISYKLFEYGVIGADESEYYEFIENDYDHVYHDLLKLYTKDQAAYLTPEQNRFVKQYAKKSSLKKFNTV